MTLVDELIGVVDEVRGTVHGALGTRPYRVYLLRRSWDGGRPGVGNFTDVETEILPPPMVRPAIDKQLRPAGPEEEGNVVLTEISLTFTEAELYPAEIGPAEKFFYRIDEGHGHGARSRFFVPKTPPTARRGDGKQDQLDWRIELRKTEDP